jgi:hypothetical protein
MIVCEPAWLMQMQNTKVILRKTNRSLSPQPWATQNWWKQSGLSAAYIEQKTSQELNNNNFHHSESYPIHELNKPWSCRHRYIVQQPKLALKVSMIDCMHDDIWRVPQTALVLLLRHHNIWEVLQGLQDNAKQSDVTMRINLHPNRSLKSRPR